MTLFPEVPDDNATAQLIAQAVAGEQQAYAELYEQFASGVYRLCYSLLLNTHDAEDVVQETFVYAFRNLARYDANKSAFKTWLYTIAVSRCRNLYRRQRMLTLDISQLLHANLAAPKQETPEAVFTQRSVQEALRDALAKLSPTLREAVVLRYGHGLAYREIAEVMNCPQKTAESRVRLAHKQLHHLLLPLGQGLLEELLQF